MYLTISGAGVDSPPPVQGAMRSNLGWEETTLGVCRAVFCPIRSRTGWTLLGRKTLNVHLFTILYYGTVAAKQAKLVNSE